MNYKLLSEDIVIWINIYAYENGLKSLICGVSGGIDSAVVSTLCAKTGLPTYCYNLPCMSHPENSDNSNLQLNWLKRNFDNVYTSTFDLSDTFITFKSGQNLTPLALANTKSRLRMVYLYAQAANLHGLVVGTGQKNEDFGAGFFTKYGDGGVDISPIADLYKSQVYGLAEYFNIPKQIQEAEPTDGLWEDNRKDIDQLIITYDEIEEIMEGRCKNHESIAIYNRHHNKNKHKMLPIPVFKVDKSRY